MPLDLEKDRRLLAKVPAERRNKRLRKIAKRVKDHDDTIAAAKARLERLAEEKRPQYEAFGRRVEQADAEWERTHAWDEKLQLWRTIQ